MKYSLLMMEKLSDKGVYSELIKSNKNFINMAGQNIEVRRNYD